ncbi:hypothetical protein F2Q70_00013380 [Brassica cretica]|uniref:Uncharacterized protein n=2 Tax=Brassica cretica TaxID=69181 RepID=A0A8S9M835_BRACR|nr:hypothetical protein F2Q68_00006411 [Brassica cretica]KAF2614198.1 hypothetical protein F2Q70_00013380 [Brassica cretica]KAF3550344.1 hypothetical protein DY000_02009878 [Brassica cretica]
MSPLFLLRCGLLSLSLPVLLMVLCPKASLVHGLCSRKDISIVVLLGFWSLSAVVGVGDVSEVGFSRL